MLNMERQSRLTLPFLSITNGELHCKPKPKIIDRQSLGDQSRNIPKVPARISTKDYYVYFICVKIRKKLICPSGRVLYN
mgnify:CR=1 FL=1